MAKKKIVGDDFFNGNEAQEQASTRKEIKMKDTIKITATTVSPLLQISEAGGQRRGYIYENGERGSVPFFSANGLRGILRRVATRQQLKAARENGFEASKLSPDDFYLLTSGASLGKKSVDTVVTVENEKEIREAFPVLSIFGAGLSAIEGKSAIANFFPSKEMQYFGETEDGKRYSLLIGKSTDFRVDSIKDAGLWKTVIDVEDIKKWSEEYAKKVGEAKEKKKSGEAEKETDSHIQQPVNLEFIIPGVKLTSSINEKYGWEFTDVEVGCILSALKEVSVMQIGSAKRIGFGLLDWTVEMGGEKILESKCTPDYILERTVHVTEAGEKYIKAWEDWLKENATNISIEEFAKG